MKLPLCADMTVNIENPRQFTSKKLPELINVFLIAARYKINTQKSTECSY